MKKGISVVLCLIMFGIGWLSSDIAYPKNIKATKTVEYKVVKWPEKWPAKGKTGLKEIENFLNVYGVEGWQVLPMPMHGFFIFRR